MNKDNTDIVKDTSFVIKRKESLPQRIYIIGNYIFRITAIRVFKWYIPIGIEYLRKQKNK